MHTIMTFQADYKSSSETFLLYMGSPGWRELISCSHKLYRGQSVSKMTDLCVTHLRTGAVVLQESGWYGMAERVTCFGGHVLFHQKGKINNLENDNNMIYQYNDTIFKFNISHYHLKPYSFLNLYPYILWNKKFSTRNNQDKKKKKSGQEFLSHELLWSLISGMRNVPQFVRLTFHVFCMSKRRFLVSDLLIGHFNK